MPTGQPKKRCAAKNRRGKLCAKGAGWGTDHPGHGRCKLHGGASPIKHGRFSRIARARLGQVFEEMEADPEPLNLLPDLILIRAQVAFLLEKHGPSPMVAELAEKAAKIADLILKRKSEGAITLQTLQRVVEQLGVAVARHVKDPDVLAAIERDWGSIQLGA
jgi:hypothetical protein